MSSNFVYSSFSFFFLFMHTRTHGCKVHHGVRARTTRSTQTFSHEANITNTNKECWRPRGPSPDVRNCCWVLREASIWKHQQRLLWGAQGWTTSYKPDCSRGSWKIHHFTLFFPDIHQVFMTLHVSVIRQQHSKRPSIAALGRRQMWYDICVSARWLV